jgi:hypothetical protein
VRGQYTVVEDEVDARARRERGESFQQLHRFEQERRRAAGPLSFQGEQHSAVGGPRHSLLRDRRPENVAGKLFEAVAAVGGDVDVGGWLSPSSRWPLHPFTKARDAQSHTAVRCPLVCPRRSV